MKIIIIILIIVRQLHSQHPKYTSYIHLKHTNQNKQIHVKPNNHNQINKRTKKHKTKKDIYQATISVPVAQIGKVDSSFADRLTNYGRDNHINIGNDDNDLTLSVIRLRNGKITRQQFIDQLRAIFDEQRILEMWDELVRQRPEIIQTEDRRFRKQYKQ